MSDAETEIERKFLVADPAVVLNRTGQRIEQAYLFTDHTTLVRLSRLAGRWRLTIKDARPRLVRNEFHVVLPDELGAALFGSGAARVSAKLRYQVPYQGRMWFVDVHDGTGFALAEVELTRAGEELEIPPWCGAEVTGDPAFLDVAMARPRQWPAQTGRSGDRT